MTLLNTFAHYYSFSADFGTFLMRKISSKDRLSTSMKNFHMINDKNNDS